MSLLLLNKLSYMYLLRQGDPNAPIANSQILYAKHKNDLEENRGY